MKIQIISLSLLATLAVTAAPLVGSPAVVGGSAPVQTAPTKPQPVLPPGLNQMPGQNKQPNVLPNLGITPGAGKSTVVTNITPMQPGVPGQLITQLPIFTNRLPNFTNQLPNFTNQLPNFTNGLPMVAPQR